jgi:purine-binding chemotaxis protein CheW
MENASAPHAQQNLSVVAFRLNQRTFALPLDVIVQILPMMTITPIPHLSKIVKGTINVRGEDVLVINLRTHFNLEEVELQLYTPLLLLKLKDRLLALIVDAVLDVMNLPLETLTNLQSMMPDGIESIPLLQGVSRYNDDSILVLDPNNLFYDQHGVAQQITQLRTSALFDTPVTDTPVEDALVSISADKPVTEKKPAAKKTPGSKKTLIETSAPIIEDAPVAATSAPIIEATPAATSMPAEDAAAPLASEPPTLENGQ